MERGLFITFEGPDGSGKSTQVEYLREYFAEKGIPGVFTREPGGTEIGEKIRGIILDRHNAEMGDMTEALLYADSRAQHVEEKIRPALEQGMVVVCDRYVDSSVAYQGYGRNMGEQIREINRYAIQDCVPDLTFLIEIDPREGRKRIQAGDRDRMEKQALAFHRRVYRGYQQMAALEPQRFVVIDGTQDRETMRRQIRETVDKALSQRNII